MPGIENLAIKFESDAVAPNTLVVTSLVGTERMSAPFRFELELVSRDPDLDLPALLYAPARLGLLGAAPGGDGRVFRWFHGALEALAEVDQTHGLVRYRAVLVPDLWRLSQSSRSRIFQGKTIDELAGAVLKADLRLEEGQDWEARLSRGGEGDRETRDVYPEREYVVQYEETDLAFLSRWLEHEGICYFFENDGTREKVVLADAAAAFRPALPGARPLRYRPEGGGGEAGGGGASASGAAEEVTEFVAYEARQPERVVLNDYNWRDPSTALATSQAAEGRGQGTFHEYNDHYKTPGQGKALAVARAGEAHCRTRTFRGKSTCRALRPGTTFALEGHFRRSFDGGYAVVAVRHAADQTVNFDAGRVTAANYTNELEAIPEGRDFRPARETPWPSIKGVMHARVDSAGDGKFADLDAEGRYMVRVPFDEAEVDPARRAPDGTASRRIRMAQPYAGASSGLHFPLLKGTEVLLTHIDGDPDRPIIAAAVPNPEATSPVDLQNHRQNRLQTTSGNVLVFDDDPALAGYFFMDPSGSHIRDLRHPAPGAAGGPAPGGGGGGEPLPAGARALDAPPAGALAELSPAARAAAAAGPPLPRGVAAGRRPAGPGGGRGGDEGATDTAAPEETSTVELFLAQHPSLAPVWGTAHGQFAGAGFDFARAYKFEADHADTATLSFSSGVAAGVSTGAASYDFDDIARSVSVTRADKESVSIGLGALTEDAKQDGDVVSTSKHTGNAKSTSTHLGDASERTTHVGNSDSLTMHVGNAASLELSVGTSVAVGLRAGVDMETSLFLGDKIGLEVMLATTQSAAVGLGGVQSLSVTLTRQEDVSVVLGPKGELALSIGPVANTSLVLGPTVEMTLGIGPKDSLELITAPYNSLHLGLAPTTETSLALSYALEFGLFLGAKDSLDLILGTKNELGLVLGAASEINIFAGAKLGIDISASIILEIAIAAAAGIKLDISADGVKKITIPKEDEVALQTTVTTLQRQVSNLNLAVASLQASH